MWNVNIPKLKLFMHKIVRRLALDLRILDCAEIIIYPSSETCK